MDIQTATQVLNGLGLFAASILHYGLIRVFLAFQNLRANDFEHQIRASALWCEADAIVQQQRASK